MKLSKNLYVCMYVCMYVCSALLLVPNESYAGKQAIATDGICIQRPNDPNGLQRWNFKTKLPNGTQNTKECKIGESCDEHRGCYCEKGKGYFSTGQDVYGEICDECAGDDRAVAPKGAFKGYCLCTKNGKDGKIAINEGSAMIYKCEHIPGRDTLSCSATCEECSKYSIDGGDEALNPYNSQYLWEYDGIDEGDLVYDPETKSCKCAIEDAKLVYRFSHYNKKTKQWSAPVPGQCMSCNIFMTGSTFDKEVNDCKCPDNKPRMVKIARNDPVSYTGLKCVACPPDKIYDPSTNSCKKPKSKSSSSSSSKSSSSKKVAPKIADYSPNATSASGYELLASSDFGELEATSATQESAQSSDGVSNNEYIVSSMSASSY